MFTRNWYWVKSLQGLKDRHPYLRNLPNQSFNLNKVQVTLGQDCYDIHYPLKFKKSDDKTAPLAVKLKIGWALSGHLPVKQATTFATTANAVSEDKIANQLSKWWDIESYASNCDVTGQLKRQTETNQNIEANNSIHWCKMRSWTSMSRRGSEVTK